MKPSSILLLTAAGLASALPTVSGESGVARRSFFDRAVDAIGARNLIPLNANTAPMPHDKAAAPAPPPPAAETEKKDAVTTTTTSVADAVTTTAAAAVTTTAAAEDNAAVTETVATTTAAATDAATVTTGTAATATATAAVGNGTAVDDGKGKDNGKGNGQDNGQDNGKGNDNGKGKGMGNGNGNAGKGKGMGGKGGNRNKGHGNNNNDDIGQKIIEALAQLGLQDILNASSADNLSLGDSVALLAQIISLQTMKNMRMVNNNDIIVVLNQGLKNSGLNIVINA